MFICSYVYMLCLCLYVYMLMCLLCLYVNVSICLYVHICLNVMFMFIHLYVYVYMYVHMFICYVYVFICLCWPHTVGTWGTIVIWHQEGVMSMLICLYTFVCIFICSCVWCTYVHLLCVYIFFSLYWLSRIMYIKYESFHQMPPVLKLCKLKLLLLYKIQYIWSFDMMRHPNAYTCNYLQIFGHHQCNSSCWPE